MGAEGSDISIIASAAPCGFLAMKDMKGDEYKTLWRTGSLTGDADAQSSNPMLGCLDERLALHYRYNPLLGFHLATAFTPLAASSRLRHTASDETKKMTKTIHAAFAQFRTWSDAFRSASSRVTLRFAIADALAFCEVLQNPTNTSTYNNHWDYEPLILDQDEYGVKKPSTFDLVDTSNLIDYLGVLNLLVAIRPLLAPKSTSTNQTEIMLLREESIAASVNSWLSGDLVTTKSYCAKASL
ncbi:hypothetical protein EJ08DRAFT_692881 [Tothia fuscella]|uniref:Uncharacterized protein n=1 Tax=Tothia fuscella TaxID=1048955 RepID=A0A9P4U2L1_9PEZI|nr:hypothetical protein EJ08DRAFT_692881 [Tothia fuscella]